MVHIGQIVLGLLATSSPGPQLHHGLTSQPNVVPTAGKSIAIVGAGGAGLAALDTLLQYKAAHQANWTITLFEQRHDVGGVWLPNDHRSKPPEIPMTALYPRLRTMTPVPEMTYPGSENTFPPGTPLYPNASCIEQYHQGFARKQGLYRHIKFNHTISSTEWRGNRTMGHWNLAYTAGGKVHYGSFDHLVVAAGAFRVPSVPSWRGQESWLAYRKHRQMLHSVYYTIAEEYRGAKVLVVGSGPSGRDIARKLADFAEVHMSVRHEPYVPIDPRVVLRPDITHFTEGAVVFRDKTTFEADVVMLCTGFELRFPFLESNGTLLVDPGSSQPSANLKTNLRYIYPLHKHIFSLDSSYPTTALSFVGLPTYAPLRAAAVAQSIYLTHAIANPKVLEDREVLLQQLADYQEVMRKQGHDVYRTGHEIFENRLQFDYQDDLIDYLKRKGDLPRDGKKFVEEWRREIHDMEYTRSGWKRVETMGVESKWLAGVSNESEWVTMMRRLDVWEQEQEHIELERGALA